MTLHHASPHSIRVDVPAFFAFPVARATGAFLLHKNRRTFSDAAFLHYLIPLMRNQQKEVAVSSSHHSVSG